MATKGKNTSENMGEQEQQQQQQPPTAVDRDKVKAEREARRKAKLASKQKMQDKSRDLPNVAAEGNEKNKSEQKSDAGSSKVEKSSVDVATPQADSKASDKRGNRKGQVPEKDESQPSNAAPDTDKIANELVNLKITDESKSSEVQAGGGVNFVKPEKKPTTKAERRAKQAAEREAKAAKLTENKATTTPSAKKSTDESKASARPRPKESSSPKSADKSVASKKSNQHRVKLFNHLYSDSASSALLNSSSVHPAIVRLGEQYAGGIVKGCNARGLAFMSAIKVVIAEYETPSQKEFGRSLEDVIKKCGIFLQQCRPLAVSVTNAMKFIQFQLRQLPKTEADAKVCANVCVTLLL